MTMRRILLLHGMAQNANIFYKKMSAIRKACRDVEFVFLDAPIVLEPVDIPGHTLQLLQAADSLFTLKEEEELKPRAWWRSNDERTVYYGMEKTMDVVKDVLSKSKFDGVLGFSQGATMAAIIAAILERPESYPGFIVNGKPIHPKLEFFIPISGFLPLAYTLETILSKTTPKLTTPSLHIIGDTDVIVVPERSQALVEACDPATVRVERHEGGHFIPSKTVWRNFFKNYITNFAPGFEISSPSASAPSAPSAPSSTL